MKMNDVENPSPSKRRHENESTRECVLFYCGADHSWSRLQSVGFRRRNTCLLRYFSLEPAFSKVIVPCVISRAEFFRNLFRRTQGDEKTIDVGVAFLLPASWRFKLSRAINRIFVHWQVHRQAGTFDNASTIVWCYWPGGFRLAQRMQLPGQWVFDTDHNLLQDVNRSAGDEQQIEHLLKESAEQCRLIVSGSRSMLQWFASRGVHARYLRNGVDIVRFGGSTVEPPDVQGIPHPRIGYCGTLSKWVNYDLLVSLATKRRDWSFIVIGNDYKARASSLLSHLPNITVLGDRSPSSVPSYLRALDVGLALYDSKFSSWLDGDSMKLFEYLAAGVPVVSTPFHTDLNDDFEGLLSLAADVPGFEGAIEGVLGWNMNLRKEWLERCVRFTERNTWNYRVAEAVRLLRSVNAISGAADRTQEPCFSSQ